MKKQLAMETTVVQSERHNGDNEPHIAPIYQTSTFTFGSTHAIDSYLEGNTDGAMYTRSKHPGRKALAKKIAALEGFTLIQNALTEGKTQEDVVASEVYASGMGAISASLLAILRAGDHILAQDVLYGTSEHFIAEVLPNYGISSSLVKDMNPELLEAAFKENPNTRVVHLETPANPTMTIVDLQKVSDIAHAHGAKVVVDNTFATPILQRPLEHGVDIVVHSTTKYLNGHGTVIGGAVVTNDVELMNTQIYPLIRTLGAVPSPFDMWLTDIGLKTLSVRMKQHCENAMRVASFLEGHPKIERVAYPGLCSFEGHELAQKQMDDFGAMMSFEVKGGMQAARNMLDNVNLCALAVSLGNVDTLIEHPASMTHYIVPREKRLEQGITDGLIRLSVGIEAADDIITDLDEALSYV